MSKIYQFKIELDGVEPTIWRSVQLNTDLQLIDLHYAAQVAMGWYDDHLYEFQKGESRFGDPEALEDTNVQDDAGVDLTDVFKEVNDTIRYVYDFGDNWVHNITLEKIVDAKQPLEQMLCVGGKRNCPPEDCGGIPGYLEILETIKDKESPEYKELLDWLGEEYDPEYFDMNLINDSFKELEEQIAEDEEEDWDVADKN